MNELYCLECGYFGKPYVYYIRGVARHIGKREKCHQCGSFDLQKQKPVNHRVLTFEEYKNKDLRDKYNQK